MQVYKDEVMQIAGFIVQVHDGDGYGEWSYGMFDTEDEALAFTNGLLHAVVEPVYKPVKH
jgi:hypothetical protein